MPLIRPTQREKRRYVLIELTKEDKGFKNKFIETFKEIFGEYGIAYMGVRFLDERCNDKKYLIRIKRGYVFTILITLAYMNEDIVDVKVGTTIRSITRE